LKPLALRRKHYAAVETAGSEETHMITYITISLDDEELGHIRALAQAEGLSTEEWAREIIRHTARVSRTRPRDPLFGLYADEPALTDAIDEVVAERQHTLLRAP